MFCVLNYGFRYSHLLFSNVINIIDLYCFICLEGITKLHFVICLSLSQNSEWRFIFVIFYSFIFFFELSTILRWAYINKEYRERGAEMYIGNLSYWFVVFCESSAYFILTENTAAKMIQHYSKKTSQIQIFTAHFHGRHWLKVKITAVDESPLAQSIVMQNTFESDTVKFLFIPVPQYFDYFHSRTATEAKYWFHPRTVTVAK